MFEFADVACAKGGNRSAMLVLMHKNGFETIGYTKRQRRWSKDSSSPETIAEDTYNTDDVEKNDCKASVGRVRDTTRHYHTHHNRLNTNAWGKRAVSILPKRHHSL